MPLHGLTCRRVIGFAVPGDGAAKPRHPVTRPSADRFGAAGGPGRGAGGRAPGGDGGDRRGGQGSAGVDAEVDGARQRGEGVDRAGAFAGHLLAGGGEHAGDGAVSGLAGTTQPLFGESAGGAAEFDAVGLGRRVFVLSGVRVRDGRRPG